MLPELGIKCPGEQLRIVGGRFELRPWLIKNDQYQRRFVLGLSSRVYTVVSSGELPTLDIEVDAP